MLNILKDRAYCPSCQKVTDCESEQDHLICSCGHKFEFDYFKNQMTLNDFVKLMDILPSAWKGGKIKYISPIIDNRTRLIYCVKISSIYGHDISISTNNENRCHRYSLFERCEHYFKTLKILENQ